MKKRSKKPECYTSIMSHGCPEESRTQKPGKGMRNTTSGSFKTKLDLSPVYKAKISVKRSN